MTTTLLKSLGFGFNTNGQLRTLDNDGNVTNVSFNDCKFDRKNYEELGEAITEYVYNLLETDCRLLRVPLPKIKDFSYRILSEGPRSFIFVSPGYHEKEDLLVLIHGSAPVRAGQWSRRLIISNSLKDGTQIEFIKKAMELNYGVVVFNNNDNKRNGRPILRCYGPKTHSVTAWTEYIKPAKAKRIAIIAHSAGGAITIELAKEFKEEFFNRVFSVQLTDSVHRIDLQRPPPDLFKRLKEIGINYVRSNKPLNEDLRHLQKRDDIPAFSAGHVKHEWTSSSAFVAIFNKLEEQRTIEKQKN